MASLNEIRRSFLSFFERNGHRIVPSSPLVPRNDPTLLFTNSGMVQFKNVFTGLEKRDYVRAVTSQKCVRAGGKHNDLDNVGYTARHLTFFEMLGNFSFGDYFKEAAIPFAWELLTKDFALDAEKLYVTVYHTDDEAAEIWKKIGVPEARIIRIATSDNFWQMGPTGPCGPCTEIFYDHGPEVWGGPPGSPEEDGDRFIEIWNLVFMQNEQFEDGSMRALSMQSIDTGMGLERFAALMQGTHNLFETDLIRGLVETSAQVSATDTDDRHITHHRVIADHLRSSAFLIADGVMPTNDGRGYVLRRIMRRAMRHAHLLGVDAPLMHRLVPALVTRMGQAFPELVQAEALITETLRMEETRFRSTLDRGLRLLRDEVDKLSDGATLPGDAAFRLYDTYGFPLDLTQDALREMGRSVDLDGFEAAMAAQKAKARAAWSGTGQAGSEAIWFDLADKLGPTEFLGYEMERAEGQITALVQDGQEVASAEAGSAVAIILNQTPFYAEAGGQVGDHGEIRAETGRAEITDVRRQQGVSVHVGKVVEGRFASGMPAELIVDGLRRQAIRANHSATHLLHEALRGALGDHVAQRGSLVAPDRLRFDFAHNAAVSREEIDGVERAVNDYIRQNDAVTTRVMTPEEAQRHGARALFGEKYGDEVRVVSMGVRPEGETGPAGAVYSMELCGGTHVRRTGDIGLFVVTGEGASSAGIRRIEALSGEAAYRHLTTQDARMAEIAAILKARPDEAAERLRGLMEERRRMEGELADLRRQLAMAGGAGDAPKAREVGGVSFLARKLSGVTGKDLRGLIDAEKDRLGSGVVLLIADTGGKPALAAGVTTDLTDRIKAVDLVRSAAEEMGGKGGGGRPDMAQAGGEDFARADAAIAAAEAVLTRSMAAG
ncbi:MAG: alanine--tRNA ligase [Pseudomonadota bacterium]